MDGKGGEQEGREREKEVGFTKRPHKQLNA